MKTTSVLLLGFLFLSFTLLETRVEKYNDGKLKSQIEIKNGLFNGKYISWYKNGKIKAEGIFKNNQRVGVWKIYDSLGQARIIREYENSFQFKAIESKDENGVGVILPTKTDYLMVKDTTNYFEYPKIVEKDVVISKRLWRTIEANTYNSILFGKNRLFEVITKNIIDTKKLTAFDVSSDEFRTELSIDDVKNKIAIKDFNVVGYRIKEDWFYSSKWQMGESRIIAICPVIKRNSEDKELDLFWIYYPHLRKILADEKVALSSSSLIFNLDDVFLFRSFNSVIYKESNVYDRKISDYKMGDKIKEESERIEMFLLDLEHDQWIETTNSDLLKNDK